MGRRSRGKKARAARGGPVCRESPTCKEAELMESEKGRATVENNADGDVKDLREVATVIGVRSRLTNSLVQSSLLDEFDRDEEEEEEEEEDRIELNVKPRFVFAAGLCAVCLEKSALFCEHCRMVRYCSAKHRTQGWLKHRGLCDALNEIRLSIASALSDESGVQLDAERYRVYRLQLLAILESEIGRPLELWEKEIVLYPRVCRVCRRFGEELLCCPRCGMEFFCEQHAGEHGNWCGEFEILQRFLLLQQKHGHVDPEIPNVHRQLLLSQPGYGFDELIHEIYRGSSYYRKMDCYTYSLLSHLSTIPLTTLYCMQLSCPEWENKATLTVHVLGAEFHFEGMNLHVWEKLFLHFLPNLKTLRLILIGPELRLPKGAPDALLSAVKLCNKCKSVGRSVEVSFKPGKLYHELFRDASQSLAEPDLICAFNPGLYRRTGFGGMDTWLETIREFCGKSVPVAVTSYTADEMLWEVARINAIADIEVLLQPQRNPFASIKPDRNFVSDDVNPLIYKNYYVAVVRGKSV